MSAPRLRAYVLDDEPLAVVRLAQLLEATGRGAVVARGSDPERAADELCRRDDLDVLFLDVQMPVLSGFDVLARLPCPPPVVLTTAHAAHAARAFAVDAVDYLLKPVEPVQLGGALDKVERRRALCPPGGRLASRLGGRVRWVEAARVTHIYADDKLTYARTLTGEFVLDDALATLERSPALGGFVRIHRSTLVNEAYVAELRVRFPGRWSVVLRDGRGTELAVARERALALKQRLGVAPGGSGPGRRARPGEPAGPGPPRRDAAGGGAGA